MVGTLSAVSLECVSTTLIQITLRNEEAYSHTKEGTLAAAVAAAWSKEREPVSDGMAKDATSDE